MTAPEQVAEKADEAVHTSHGSERTSHAQLMQTEPAAEAATEPAAAEAEAKQNEKTGGETLEQAKPPGQLTEHVAEAPEVAPEASASEMTDASSVPSTRRGEVVPP